MLRVWFIKPRAWTALLVLGLVCSRAEADGSSPFETEARAARAQASGNVWIMEGVARRARVILQTARKTGSLKNIACANEELSRVDMALRMGRDSIRRLLDAWDQADVALARRELWRMSAMTEAARAAGVEAEYCIDAPRPREGTTVRLIIEP